MKIFNVSKTTTNTKDEDERRKRKTKTKDENERRRRRRSKKNSRKKKVNISKQMCVSSQYKRVRKEEGATVAATPTFSLAKQCGLVS